MPRIRIQKLVADLPTPEAKTSGAAGLDLYCAADTWVRVGKSTKVPLGIAIEYPEGYMGLLAVRSSLPEKKGVFITNGAGIIDSDYRGEHMIQLAALSQDVLFKKGERIAQIVIMPVLSHAADPVVFETADSLSKTTRGEGAFGSTGHGV